MTRSQRRECFFFSVKHKIFEFIYTHIQYKAQNTVVLYCNGWTIYGLKFPISEDRGYVNINIKVGIKFQTKQVQFVSCLYAIAPGC